MEEKKPFVIFGTYSLIGTKKGNKIQISSVNLNPQSVFGANVDGEPTIRLNKKGDTVVVKWRIKEFLKGE